MATPFADDERAYRAVKGVATLTVPCSLGYQPLHTPRVKRLVPQTMSPELEGDTQLLDKALLNSVTLIILSRKWHTRLRRLTMACMMTCDLDWNISLKEIFHRTPKVDR